MKSREESMNNEYLTHFKLLALIDKNLSNQKLSNFSLGFKSMFKIGPKSLKNIDKGSPFGLVSIYREKHFILVEETNLLKPILFG